MGVKNLTFAVALIGFGAKNLCALANLLPEILFSSSDPQRSRQLAELRRTGQLRELVPRAYTSDLTSDLAVIVRRHWIKLVTHLYPESLLAYKTGLRFAPDAAGNLFFHGKKRRPVEWPGHRLYFTEGAPPLAADAVLAGSLRAPSLARGMLENYLDVRAVQGVQRTLTAAELEQRLLQLFDVEGEVGLNRLRDEARALSTQLGWEFAFQRLERVVAALLSTGPGGRVLLTQAGQAKSLGQPYDTIRVERLGRLRTYLLSQSWPTHEVTLGADLTSYQVIAFYESYFSNFIEGTEFTITEAKQIVFEGVEIAMQVEDSHDVRSLYEMCSDAMNLVIPMADYATFEDWLRRQHRHLLAKRPSKRPGLFKERANRAGDTEFVAPPYVIGTLREGYEMLAGLQHPFARAIFLMFMISEVHPFDDGNGRVARLAMNAVLSAEGCAKLIIPTVYRDDYLLGLRALTRRQDPGQYARMMQRVWGWSAVIPAGSLEEAEVYLVNSNAFKLSAEAAIVFERKVFPRNRRRLAAKIFVAGTEPESHLRPHDPFRPRDPRRY